MKLLDIEAVLNRDKGIQQARHKSQVMKELDDITTSYAILSHRWGAEVSYEEMIGVMKMEEEEREEVRQRHGYQKIIKSCEQAKKDGYKWLWIDTCCIDKRNSSELSEAINSMYRWYQNAQVCYAYFNDVGESTFPTKRDNSKFDKSNGWPEWFVRGWTLQELIAPKQVEFFSKNWVRIGDKQSSAWELEEITGIPCDVLTNGLAAQRLSVAQIMSWAANRKTTRVEDRAYSLMGLLGVNMPMLYGEGKKAFQRLQLEIIRVSSDHSIFAWGPWMWQTDSVLAKDPSDFRGCGTIRRLEPVEFVDILRRKYIEGEGLDDIDSRARRQHKLAALRGALDSHQFHTLTVSNAGIQVFLPIVSSHDSPFHLRAILACTRNGDLVTIALVSSRGSFARISMIDSPLPATYPDFKTLRLIHHRDSNETRHEIVLEDELVSCHGFTRCHTYPGEFTGNTVTPLSLVVADDLIVIVYANHNARRRFAIGLGYSLGREWVHVVDDGDFLIRKEEDYWKFGRRVYNTISKARVKHAQIMPKHDACRNELFIKRAHLPRSAWVARVVWGRQLAGNFKVIVDVRQCPGCCNESHGWAAASTVLAMPKLMATASGSYLLKLDGRPTKLSKCIGQRFALGDYGDYSRGKLVRTGNIFEDMPATGIDFDDSYRSAIYSVSGSELGRRLDWVKSQDVLAVEQKPKRTEYLALHHPMAISLPVNEHVSLLLRALSTRLAGKYLVTTVIQCLDFYTVDKDGKQWNSDDYWALNDGDYSIGTGILTPLCAISYPHVWSIDPLCKQRQKRFKSIRRNFYMLMDMPSHNSDMRQKRNRAIEFFSDLFGLKHLKNYIGDIAFFKRLPPMMETSSVSDLPSVGATEENGLRVRLLTQLLPAESDPRLESVLPLLRRRSQTLYSSLLTLDRPANERQIVKGEIKFILKTLGRDLLEHIARNVRLGFTAPYPRSPPQQRDILAVIQDIKALRVKLSLTRNEDEQRALGEDMTGKILWFFWCGIRAEVDELLPKVMEYARTQGIIEGLLEVCLLMEVTTCTDTQDDQAHLLRIMFDAERGPSKHHLWLAAQLVEQAKRTSRARHPADNTHSGTSRPHQ